MIGRRGFITGLVSLVAAPAIVRAGSLMPVKSMIIEPSALDIQQMLMDWAEKQVYPPFVENGLWEVNFDYVAGQIIQRVHPPEEWLANQ